MKYPKISNYPSFDMLSGYQGQMAELDSIRVREMMQNQELNIDKIQFTPPAGEGCGPGSRARG